MFQSAGRNLPQTKISIFEVRNQNRFALYHLTMFFKTLIVLCLAGGISTALQAQTAQFTADKTTGCFPLTVNFTDQSTGASSWSWSLGNGNSSSEPNPSAIYTSPGTYTVSLTINGGVDTETKTGYITVRDFPDGDFTFNKSTGCAPLEVAFTHQVDLSSGNITKWQWVFGDGGTSDQPNPTYVFSAPGDRSISLVVTNEYGCESTFSKASAIDINGPLVDFTPDVFTACQVPQSITFTNQSHGDGNLSYSWNFGDGNMSTSTSPSHTYTQAGLFAVRLSATDGHGCKADHEEEITIGQESGLDFLVSSTERCIGEAVTFTSQSGETIVSQNWDFGNGTSSSDINPTVAYDKAGSFVVTLTAQLQGKACQSSVTKTITVVESATPSFSSSVNCEHELTLTNTSTLATKIQWFINDNAISSQNSILYPANQGDYLVKLIAFNNLDCPNVLEKIVHVPGLPVAAFSPSIEQSCTEKSLSGCAPFPLQFENESASELSFTSHWILGEGVTSTAKHPPLRTFTNAGNFNIRLIITDSRNCKDTAEAVVRVADSAPIASFSFDKDNVCVGESIIFNEESQNADFFCWDFGDGTAAQGNSVKHAYGKPGVYTVTMTAKNIGCSDVFQIQDAITVKDPHVDFAISKSCENPFHVQLSNLSVNADHFQWDIGNGTLSTQKDTVYTFPTTGVFSIKLRGESNTTQCIVEVEKFVTIQQIKADFTLESIRPCRNVPVPIQDKSAFASTWMWFIDDVTFSDASNAIFQSDVPGAHTIKLFVTDADGCHDEKTLPVIVPDITGSFSSAAASTCDEFTVQFTDASTATPPIETWTWDFGDGEVSGDQHPEHVYKDHGTFTVTLTLYNGEGECDFVSVDEVVFNLPVPAFSIADPHACIGAPITIANQSQGAVSYQWDLGNSITSTAISPQYSYNAAGTYDITLRAKDQYGCEISLTKNNVITVGQPTADFEAFQTSGECPPLTSVFSDKSSGSVLKWFWNFGNGATSTLQHPTNVYNRPGVYGVSLRVEDDRGCFDIKTIDPLIQVGGPHGSFAPTANSVCVESEVLFTANASNTTIYRWDFGDGVVIDLQEHTAAHTYGAPGAYHPALVLIDDKGCNVTADGSGEFVVKSKPELKFDFGPECIFEGEILTLNTDAEDLTLSWSINGQAQGERNFLEVQTDSAGIYEVTLKGINDLGCSSELTEAVYVHGAIRKIPNVFTPNGDAANQFFVIENIEKSSWTLHLFNRWGKEIFAWQHYSNNWEGDGMAAGVYYYTLVNERCPSRRYKGYVNILK